MLGTQIYSTNTTFENPTIRLLEHPTPLDIIAIPTLPSLVPEIASKDFSAQLLPLVRIRHTTHTHPPQTWNLSSELALPSA